MCCAIISEINKPKCNKTYKYKSSLSKHLKYECGVEKQFRCTLCSYSGKQKAHLISHMRNVHKILLR
ncbi:hypothetical protein D910_06819 [Dendroctonus ponderosae]